MRSAIILGLGAALLACGPVSAHDGGDHMSSKGQISVSATGDAQQAPDMATVSAGVVTEGPTAGEAMRANARLMSAVFAQLKSAGIQENHITTSQLSLQPRYDYQNRQKPRITGYETRNTVSAKTYDLENVGPMLDALVAAGVNNINGVNFGIKDSKGAQTEARKEAIKNARRKAEEMALAAGVRLGNVTLISEGGAIRPPQPVAYGRMMAAEAMDVSTPVAPGEQTLSVSVNMVFEIVQ